MDEIPTGPQWWMVARPGGVQVIPLGDLVSHIESPHCVCVPKVSLMNATCCIAEMGEGRVLHVHPSSSAQYVRQLVSHNAMDGRK